MQISCSNCEYSREIDDSKVPDWAEAVKCPQCGHRIPLGDPPLEFLPSYGANPHQSVGQAEPLVAATPAASQAIRPSLPQPPLLPVERRESSEAPDGTDIPWESRQGGFFGYFFSTIGGVLFRPSRFFDNMRPGTGYLRPMAFVVIIAYLQTVCSESITFGLQHVLADTIEGIQSPLWRDFVEKLIGIKMYHPIVIAMIAISPLLSPLYLFVLAYLIHAFLPSAKENDYRFQSTYRIAAYTSVVKIFGAIPLVGWLISLVWGVKITVIGLSRVYQINKDRLFWGVVAAYIVAAIVLGAVLTIFFNFIFKLIILFM